MANETPATRALARAGVSFSVYNYDYNAGADSIGLAAANALAESPSRVLKTLMVQVDGKAACAILASDQTLSMKRLAAAAGGKSAAMLPPAEAERMTGYKIAGISPLGQRKAAPIFLDAAAASQSYVFVNGGQRGLQIRLAPKDLIAATHASVVTILSSTDL